jgi:hypothetical protein
MLRQPSDIEVDRVVYLYPRTRQASRNVHRQLAVSVAEDPARSWPMISVVWSENDERRTELVHRDNIRLRPPSAPAREPRVRTLPGRSAPAIDGQEGLW